MTNATLRRFRITPMRAAAWFAGAAALVAGLLPWWRNHGILRDFCDYGLVISAVGRMSLGEKPYVDFLTPIQTLQFTACWLAERLWGARYLSLTYLNAAFIALSVTGLFLLTRRALGCALSLLLATAVVVATAAQHTIVWYNAMGLIWLTSVVWTCAQRASEPRRPWRWFLLTALALWLGGMTKITFQIAALAFAFAFLLWDRAAGRVRTGQAAVLGLGYVLVGVVAPVATELAWTGASLTTWVNNVVTMAASGRTAMLQQIATVSFYTHTPHDYYHPLLFPFAGAWGVALLVTVAILLVRHPRRTGAAAPRNRFALTVLLVGAWICSAVLLATNMDIVYVSAASWLVFAVGLVLASEPAVAARPVVRGVLAAGAIVLLVPAWIDAWRGTRALWGHSAIVRAELVGTQDLPPAFRYLRGLRVVPSWRDGLQDFHRLHEELVRAGTPASAFYFVHATDWMVRAYPQARHGGLPLWLAKGTTLSEESAVGLAQRIQQNNDIRIIVADAPWNYWPTALNVLLKERFRPAKIGGRIHVYQPRDDVWPPLEFASSLGWNLYANDMVPAGGDVAVLPWTDQRTHFLGGWESYRINFGFGLYRLTGEMVAQLRAVAEAPQTAHLQIRARDNDRLTDVLWEEQIEVTAAAPTVTRPFAISPGGRPVTLVVELPTGGVMNAGWRGLRTDHAGQPGAVCPGPADRRLKRQTIDAAGLTGLFSSVGRAVPETLAFSEFPLAGGRTGERADCGAEVPTEIWFRIDQAASHVSGQFGLRELAWSQPGGLTGAMFHVVYYKSGRFEVLHSRELQPRTRMADREPQTFRVHVPETVGWIGLIVVPTDLEHTAWGHSWWRDIRLE